MAKELHHRLGLASKYGSWQWCQKSPLKRYLPSFLKFFLSLFLSCIFYFVGQIRKTCYRKEWKTEPLKSWFWLIESLKMTLSDPMHGYWIFCQVEGIWNCFLHPNRLPNPSKITVTWPKSLKWTSMVKFDLTKVSRMTISFELLKAIKITSLKIYMSPKWPVWRSTSPKSRQSWKHQILAKGSIESSA